MTDRDIVWRIGREREIVRMSAQVVSGTIERGSTMNSMYTEIFQKTDIRIGTDAFKQARGMMKLAVWVKTGLFMTALAIILMAFFLPPQYRIWYFSIPVIIYTVFLGCVNIKLKKYGEMDAVLYNACEPDRWLSWFLAFTTQDKKASAARIKANTLQIVDGLLESGRFKEAEIVLEIFRKYAVNRSEEGLYQVERMKMAFYEDDANMLKGAVAKADQIAKNEKDPEFVKSYAFAAHYRELLWLMQQKNWEEAMRYTKTYLITPKAEMIDQVRGRYYLWRCAKAMGDEAMADKQQTFIEANGGTTWYKKAVMNCI